MNAIEINGLTKRYKDVVAVNNLCLSVKKGELFALLGVNGAGKTTTIKMLTCLLRPSEGDAFVCNHSVLSAPDKVKEIIGVSPQETAVSMGLTVRENLELMCGAHGFSKEKTESKITELADLLNLNSVLQKRANKLSGGFQRRLSIAMALISEPCVLFLDEPTLGLDVFARSDLWNVVRALREKITIVLTTHYMEEAESLSSRVGIMANGNLLAVGTVEEIKTLTKKERFEDAFIAVVKGESVR